MALPTALFAMIATFALASVAILSSVDAQHGTIRDRQSKEAIAAADSGASVALLRLNRFQGNLSEANPCIGPSGESVVPQADGWCPATPAESVGESTFSYQVSAFEENAELSVIAVGTAGTVSRRIEVGLVSHHDEQIFANEQLIGQDDIFMDGTADIFTDIGTNGEITGSKSNSYSICGNVRIGVGKAQPKNPPDCEGEVIEGNKDLPPVNPPDGLATENSNCRLELTCENPAEVDTYEKNNKPKSRTATNPWDAENRWINVQGGATLTMGGADYFVCGVTINSGELIMASEEGVQVRIFVDTPENCGLEPGAAQVQMIGSPTIGVTGFGSSENYAVPEIYVLGESTVKVGGGTGANQLILYAPESDVELWGSATWTGLIAGKSLTFSGTPRMEEYPGEGPKELTYSTLWERTHYVECTGAEGSPPNSDC